MYYVEVEKNVKLFVQDLNPQGEKTVLFLHGWPLSHRMYEYQFNVLPRHGFRCIGVDLRGFGGSDSPWSGYSYNQMADDIYAVIDTLKLKDIILAGFSMGGAIAIRYMARHKEHAVRKLALISAAAPSFTRQPGYPYGMTKEEVTDLIRLTYLNRPEMLTDFTSNFFAVPVTPSFMNWFNGIGLEASGFATIKTAESLRDEVLFDDLSKIHVKTGIFHGLLDKICPYEFAVELNKGIIGSELYPFEYSGHGIFYDELGRFNYALITFFDA